MNYIHLSDFQVNGFGLLNQPINIIKEEDLLSNSKSYDELLEERNIDDDYKPTKLIGNLITFERTPTKYEAFLAEAAELTESQINHGDQTKYFELKKQIDILERAFYQLETNYNGVLTDFNNLIHSTKDFKNTSELVQLYWQNAYINMFCEFIERVKQKNFRKSL